MWVKLIHFWAFQYEFGKLDYFAKIYEGGGVDIIYVPRASDVLSGHELVHYVYKCSVKRKKLLLLHTHIF